MRTAKLILHTFVGIAMVFYTLATALLAVPSIANAQTAGAPATIGYNGRLFNASGTALSGTYYFWVDLESDISSTTTLASNIQGFADADGDGVVDAGETAITVTNGFFTIEIPISTDIQDFNNQVWLQLKAHTADVVASAESFSPLVKVTKTPYAIVSQAIERSAADPTTGFEGRMYYDTDEDEIKFYDGTAAAWVTLASTLDDAYNNFGTAAQIIVVDDAVTGIEFSVEAAGNYMIDLQSTGDFVVQDAGSTWATFSDAQALTVAGSGAISLTSTSTSGITIDANADTASLVLRGGDTNPSAGADGNDVAIETEDDLLVESTGDSDFDVGGAFNVDSTGAISLDAAAASNLTTSAGALTLSGAAGVNVAGSASEIDVTTTGALDINSGAGTWDSSAGISIDAVAASNLTVTSTGAGQDLTISQAGAFNSSILLVSNGTGADAISLDADNQSGSGIVIDAYDSTNNTTGLVQLDGAAVQINTYGSIAGLGNAGLDVNVGLTGTLSLATTNGAISISGGGASGSVDVTSAVGSITVDTQTASSAISIGTSNVTRSINVGTGTGADTITLGAGADLFNFVSTSAASDSFNFSAANTTSDVFDIDNAAGTTGDVIDITYTGTTGAAIRVTDSTGDDANDMVFLNNTDTTVGGQTYLVRGQYAANGDTEADFLLFEDNGGTDQFVIGQDGDVVITGSADGTDALTITTGDILVSNGDLTGSGGDFDWTLDAADDANISKTATAAATEEGLEIDFNAGAGDGSDVYSALKIDVASANHSAATDIVYGIVIDALASADAEGAETGLDIGSGWDVGLSLSSPLVMDDDTAIAFGTSSDTSFLWETADANANEMLIVMPEGGATNVPVMVVADVSALNVDLGLFDGVTDPTIAILSDDNGDYSRWSVSDAGLTTFRSGTAGITFEGSGTGNIVLNIAGVTANAGEDGDDIALEADDDVLVAADDEIDLTSTGLMDINAGANLDIDVTGAYTMDSTTSFSIDGTGTSSNVTLTSNGAADDLTIALAGAFNSSLILSSAGTDADAMQITTSAGGLDITVAGAAAGEDLDLLSNEGISLTSTKDMATAIYLHANGGTSEGIRLYADQGTGVNSILLVSDDGGLTLTSGSLASDDAINLTASSGGVDIDGAMQVNIASSENTADALVISSSAGGIDISATGNSATENIDITGTTAAINLTSTLEDATAIVLTASSGAGGVTIAAGTSGINVDSAGVIAFDDELVAIGSEGADGNTANGDNDLFVAADFEVDGIVDLDGSFDFDGTTFAADASGAITLTSTLGDATAIVLDADGTASGGITMLANTGGVNVTLTATGPMSVDGDLMVIGGTADGNTATADGDLYVVGDLEVDSIVDIDGSFDFDGTTFDVDGSGLVSLTSTTDANQGILISTTVGGIDITAVGNTLNDNLDLTGTLAAINLTSTLE
ncbi:hypothetical protein HY630_01395, partial [Candidatus Uhrbacteria bacterium]|nr:hypothetical protein [Candidatus Uhrbacteria bacterium]